MYFSFPYSAPFASLFLPFYISIPMLLYVSIHIIKTLYIYIHSTPKTYLYNKLNVLYPYINMFCCIILYTYANT